MNKANLIEVGEIQTGQCCLSQRIRAEVDGTEYIVDFRTYGTERMTYIASVSKKNPNRTVALFGSKPKFKAVRDAVDAAMQDRQ